MYDLRKTKNINLDIAECLKEETTYKFQDESTGKKLIAKFISNYDDSNDVYLITEFKKLALLSGEPEIATVYYLATGKNETTTKSCYIMDFIEGQTLQMFLDQREYIVYEVLLDIILQLASGMEKAHNFEIFHSDLHNENILINNFGYLKIIDFLWWDYNLSMKTNQLKDIEDFKRIINEFNLKLKIIDKKRFEIIYNYCLNVKTFKGLKKEIETLDEISFEVSLIKDKTKNILSHIFEATNLNSIHMALEITNQEIPNIHIPPLNEQENKHIKQKENRIDFKNFDSRISKVETNMNNLISPKLFSLKQIGLLDWKVWITNTGKTFEGPYEYNLRIWFTSKFLKWKRTNELIQFVENNNTNLKELILE